MQTSIVDYGALTALVAFSNAQLGQTVWHFLRDQGVGGGRLVTSTRDAVARMEQGRFSLIFVDYDLPDFGGADFVKFVRMCDGPAEPYDRQSQAFHSRASLYWPLPPPRSG